ncbi:hypothetical protein [Brucella cytisi]|nr:hypothetical protein [Brucella cytisi]
MATTAKKTNGVTIEAVDKVATDVGIAVESLPVFIRFWITTTQVI